MPDFDTNVSYLLDWRKHNPKFSEASSTTTHRKYQDWDKDPKESKVFALSRRGSHSQKKRTGYDAIADRANMRFQSQADNS